jgi:hypothetical protein
MTGSTLDQVTGEPPDDPEDWTDEQWLGWLEETDAEVIVDHAVRPGFWDRSAVEARTRRQAASALRVMHDLYHGIAPREEVAIVIEASGDPPSPDGIDVDLDPDDPAASTAVVHVHLTPEVDE